jgi:hypothetical protein
VRQTNSRRWLKIRNKKPSQNNKRQKRGKAKNLTLMTGKVQKKVTKKQQKAARFNNGIKTSDKSLQTTAKTVAFGRFLSKKSQESYEKILSGSFVIVGSGNRRFGYQCSAVYGG